MSHGVICIHCWPQHFQNSAYTPEDPTAFPPLCMNHTGCLSLLIPVLLFSLKWPCFWATVGLHACQPFQVLWFQKACPRFFMRGGSFSIMAPKLWNSPPQSLHNTFTISSFKESQMKTFIFSQYCLPYNYKIVIELLVFYVISLWSNSEHCKSRLSSHHIFLFYHHL